MKLTDTRIRNLPAKDALVRDDGSPLAVRVSRHGAKSLVCVWRHQGKVRKAHVARVGDLVLGDAREKAREMFKAQLDNGGTLPAPVKIDTLAELAAVYQQRQGDRDRPWSEAHKQFIEGAFRVHILPGLGATISTGLSHRACQDWFDGLRAAGVKPAARRRAIEVLCTMLRWAIVKGRMPGPNPTVGIDRPVKGARDRVLTREEMAAYNVALDEASDRNGADACRLLALTGLRMGQLPTLRWDQVDLESGLIAFDARQMKSNRKFVKNICRDAIEIISRQPRTSELIFPPTATQRSTRPHREDFDYVSNNAQALAGIKGATPCHIFRHVFKSYGLRLRVDAVRLNVMQDHKNPGMLGTYGHLEAESVRPDEERLQTYLADCLYGRERENVVAIGAA